MNQIIDYLAASRLVPSPGFAINYTPFGIAIGLDVKNGSDGVDSSLIMCRITALDQMNYIRLKKFDGDAVYGDEIVVAKEPLGRRPVSETIDTSTITYTYTDENTRSSSDGTNTETQVVYPCYTVNQVVWIQAVDHSGVTYGGDEVLYMEMKPSRLWVRKYIQP